MASFDTAYNKYIKPNEGGYANVTGDKGGETYGGIARNFFPGWLGWRFIDDKKKAGPIKNNTTFRELDSYTTDFYRTWWNDKYLGQIANQDVANLLFDYNVNSGATAIKAVQRLVGVTADGAMGPMTVAAINKAEPTKLYNDLLAQRKGLYEKIVANDPTQAKFWNGWMNRLSNFPKLVTPTNTLLVVGLLIGVGLIIYNTMTPSKAAH